MLQGDESCEDGPEEGAVCPHYGESVPAEVPYGRRVLDGPPAEASALPYWLAGG